MRTLRFYVPQPLSVGDTFNVPDSTARHMVQVLRLPLNAEITLFNGDDCEYCARIIAVQKKRVQVEVFHVHTVSRESPINLQLVQAVAKGDRMDWIIQKAVELGVASIQPVISQRSNVNLPSDRWQKKLAHWQGIITSACEQCGRNRVPDIFNVKPLAEIAEQTASLDAHKVIFSPKSQTLLSAQQFSGVDFIMAVGPEGGFDDDEEAFLAQKGYDLYNLGPRILRTETAAISAIALVQALAGDL